MSLSTVTGNRATYWLSTRPGPVANGTPYLALVSDLVDGDFLCGPRATVVTAGSTTSGEATSQGAVMPSQVRVGWVPDGASEPTILLWQSTVPPA
jgi:hypothetical protein